MAQLVLDQHNPAPYKPGGVAYNYNPSTGEAENRRTKFKRSSSAKLPREFQASLGDRRVSKNTPNKNKTPKPNPQNPVNQRGLLAHACNPSTKATKV